MIFLATIIDFVLFDLPDSQNKVNLERIEKSLFVLCLDESPLEYPSDHQKSLADPDYTVTSREMLHGGGTKSNSGNRWFDKIFQVSHRHNSNHFFRISS